MERNRKPTLYQVAILGPKSSTKTPHFKGALKARCERAGFDFATISILEGRSVSAHDRKLPISAIYFGDRSAPPTLADIENIKTLQTLSTFILPVVPDLKSFTSSVPEQLKPINGMELRSDTDMEIVARRTFESLGLERTRRLAFISYRRADASACAQQVHRTLDERCWESFLDTHSIDTGVDFQPTLWDRMNDADILVLLDSPGLLDSTWIAQEIENANQLGMGVVQLVWPGHERDPRTGFSKVIYLKREDFVRGNMKRDGGLRLKQGAMHRVMLAIEELRARSLRMRRERMVTALSTYAKNAGLSVSMTGFDEVRVVGQKTTYVVYPVIGHVDSITSHRRHGRARRTRAALLYDPTGLLKERLDHINWLSNRLPVKNIAVTEASKWVLTI